MSISVALCVCNGGRHLRVQLDSLAVQTCLPGELVVCDDASTDTSIAIIEDFARQAPFPVFIKRNERRLGIVANFEQVIRTCNGNVIALCDQDDSWHPDKLEKLAVALTPPGVLAVFSDAEVVDADLAPLGYTMWQRVLFTPHEQDCLALGDGVSVLLKHHIVTGATLAFKNDLCNTALPIPAGWAHDAWLALMAAAQGTLVAVPEPLIAYRQHGGNVVGGLRKSLGAEARAAFALDRSDWYRDEISMWNVLAERLGDRTPTALLEKLDHIKTRANFPSPRWQRLPGVVRELVSGRYSRFARNWGSIAIDLLVK